ncbi:DNA replication protein [Veillonella criceti]|uniref:DNA replication protein n=2 Tax=Veillonella criceti TaxID=103891 RepID=A0A380NJD4_9FIRM|nr:DNA replication protein [Veillonella criceti]
MLIGPMTPTIFKPINWEYYGIYKRYQKVTLEDMTVLDVNKEAFDVIKEYAEHVVHKLDVGLGLIIKGPVGTGKTTAAVAIMKEAIQNKRSPYFISMISLLDKLMSLRDQEERYEFEQRIKNCSLLVLDDLGGEYIGKDKDESFMLKRIMSIIAERNQRSKSTIITTNLKIKELKERYDERVIDRLGSTNQIITLSGPSLRREEWREL